jgi:excisionase family DNA binding protein
MLNNKLLEQDAPITGNPMLTSETVQAGIKSIPEKTVEGKSKRSITASPLAEQFRNVRLLTVKELSELLGVGQRTAWRLAADGSIPRPVAIGNRLKRWRLSDIEHFVAGRKL